MIFRHFWGIFWTIVSFGGSILVHELGHYLSARRRGLWIPRFSIGFGPKLFSWKKEGTEFRISLFPLGGYVSLPQMTSLEATDGEWELPVHPLRPLQFSDRVAIAAMGPAMNVLLSFVLACVLWILGQSVEEGNQTSTVGFVPAIYRRGGIEYENSAVARTSLRGGDRIVSVDGHPLRSFSELPQVIALGHRHGKEDQPTSLLRISRNGEIFTVEVPVLLLPEINSKNFLRVLPIFPVRRSFVGEVLEKSPAGKCGLEQGDELIAYNGEKIFAPQMLQELVGRGTASGVLTVVRSGKFFDVSIQPQFIFPSSAPELHRPAIGIVFERRTELVHPNPFALIGQQISMTLRTLESLFRRDSEVGIGNMMGMPGIARLLHRLSMDDFRELLGFLIGLNVGLAALNLLPIPALDGGHILFAIWEKVTGKRLPERPTQWLQAICLLGLLLLMFYVSTLDILRWRGEFLRSPFPKSTLEIPTF
ncbi:MAG: RIP metalloprotease RseP [Puniceicoccales bacterium]|jgi:regulator of sigma E protease|nr:RIP metalloprotease RseP [Puniceicoccales bacterium]